MSEYYTQFKMLWDELLVLRPIPNCNCNLACACDDVAKAKEYQQNDQVIRFLKGLNNFANARSHIMLIESIPVMKKAFEMILQ